MYQVQVSSGASKPEVFTSISGESTKRGKKRALESAIGVAECRVEEGQWTRVTVMEYDDRGRPVDGNPVWDSEVSDGSNQD